MLQILKNPYTLLIHRMCCSIEIENFIQAPVYCGAKIGQWEITGQSQ